MTLVINETIVNDEKQEIADKTKEYASIYQFGLNKLSLFVMYLKPFVYMENILYDKNNNTYWNRQNSVKFCLYELMNQIWEFQSNIALMEIEEKTDTINSNSIDSDSEIEQDIKIVFNKLFINNPNEINDITNNICNVSLILIKNITQILSMDFGEISSDMFKLDSFLNNEIVQTIQCILTKQYSSHLMDILLKIANLILNKGKNGQNELNYYPINEYDTSKYWKLFMESISNYNWSSKNISLFIDNILLENINNNLFESFVVDWISSYLNVNLPTNKTSETSESYTSLIISLQKLLNGSNISCDALLSILKLIVGYIDSVIEETGNHNITYSGITKNKTEVIIRCLSNFLQETFDDDELLKYQLLIVSKLFTLCFICQDNNNNDTEENIDISIATICEYIFKKIVKYHNKLYGELLECIAKSLRLPWYFTNKNETIEPAIMKINNNIEIPIIINKNNPSRWIWCIQCLLLLQSTTFEYGLHLINIILDRKDLEYIFSLSLSDTNNTNTLIKYGVSLFTLQKCRDVICDLSDLIGMSTILFVSNDNNNKSLSKQQIELCNREWLICWLLSFEEKLSWLPISILPDLSIIKHTKQWKKQINNTQSITHLFALFCKPRVFSSVFQNKLKIIPQQFIDNIIINSTNSDNNDSNLSFYCKQCPIDIKSRVIGYFVNILNDTCQSNKLKLFCVKLFSNNQNIENKILINNIKTMQSVFVMFPDFIPISFIRYIITESNKLRENISNLTQNENELNNKLIIQQLQLLYEILRPIHCIALNITGSYRTPSYSYLNNNYSTYSMSTIWEKHRELLVGTLFELFSYLNRSFEWYLQQNTTPNTNFKHDIFFWFSICLTTISHSLIGMNSEGEQDVFFELDWSSLISTTNLVIDHILHKRKEFTLSLNSYVCSFYELINNNNNHINILNNINCEFRYNMITLWHCMSVLRQIALRSTDLFGRKNLKTKKKSLIFESLQLLIEILGNDMWRNILSSEALASPIHKLSLNEMEVEEFVLKISNISNVCNDYEIHAILDELYFSINDLLNHPIIQNKLINISSIPETWHYKLFDALNSSHHQIVGSAFRILSISTRLYVKQNINVLFNDDEKENIHNIVNKIIPKQYLLPHNTHTCVASKDLRLWFLTWYLFINVMEECPLEFKLEIVSVMKHDNNKYKSPLGSYAFVLREIIEHLYVAPALELLMNDFIEIKQNKINLTIFQFPFELDDFYSNYPSDDPNITSNMLSRYRWLSNNNTIKNAFNKNIFFSNLCIRVYDKAINYFPVLTRYIIQNLKDRVTRNIVTKITSSQFSPIILKNIFNKKQLNKSLKQLRQKNNLTNSTFKLSDDIILKMNCNFQTREIEVLYLCEEISISMIILYPFDYPLKGLSFHWKETCGLPQKKTKNWQMLLMSQLNNQNATICEAFLLLSINISKHYQGIDECPICYSVVHPTKKTLPKVKCLTCKGKFHRYCIYKWTKTSQKSTCPLCRSLI